MPPLGLGTTPKEVVVVGFTDYFKEMMQEESVMGMGYAVISGLASGTAGALLKRYTNNNEWAAWLGYILGSAGMAYVADKFLKKPTLRKYALFGGLFPPVWERVTDYISPDQVADKIGSSLGLTWKQAAMSVPTTLVVEPAQPAPAQPITTEEFMY